MTGTEIQRVEWHLSVPACSIKSGVNRHLSFFDCDELKLLCRYFNCSIGELVDLFYQKANHGKVKKRKLTSV